MHAPVIPAPRRRLLSLSWRTVDFLALAAYSPVLALVMPRTTTLPAWWLSAVITSALYLMLALSIRLRKPAAFDPLALRNIHRLLLTRTSLWTGRALALTAVIATCRGSAIAASELITGAHVLQWESYPLFMTLGIWLIYLILAALLAMAAWLCINVPALVLRRPGTRLSAARRALIQRFS